MGYTHYWNNKKDFTDTEWEVVRANINTIVEHAIDEWIVLGDRHGEKPIKNCPGGEASIGFNGFGDESHETFVISKSATDFSFCKTARKPYDDAVVACLIFLDNTFPDFSCSSDGEPEDWEAGLKLAERALGASFAIPPDV